MPAIQNTELRKHIFNPLSPTKLRHFSGATTVKVPCVLEVNSIPLEWRCAIREQMGGKNSVYPMFLGNKHLGYSNQCTVQHLQGLGGVYRKLASLLLPPVCVWANILPKAKKKEQKKDGDPLFAYLALCLGLVCGGTEPRLAEGQLRCRREADSSQKVTKPHLSPNYW